MPDDELRMPPSWSGADPTVGERVRLSGTIGDRPDPGKAINAFYCAWESDGEAVFKPTVYESNGKEWTERGELQKSDITGSFSGLLSERPDPDKTIGWVYRCTDTGMLCEAFPGVWFELPTHVESLVDAASRLPSSTGFAKLRSMLTRQFGIRLQSTGDALNTELTRVILQTLDASPENPYLVEFNQHILDPFTGPGQFDLVERDLRRRAYDGASDGGTPVLFSEDMDFQPGDAGELIRVGTNPGKLYSILSVDGDEVTLDRDIILPTSGATLTMDGAVESEVTIATKSGFADGITTGSWSQLRKAITADKVYKVVFVPGDAGDGIYSTRVGALYPVPPDQTPILS